MTKAHISNAALKLPVEDRLALAEELWESVEADAVELPLHAWQKEILDQRRAEAAADPDSWLTHEEVMVRVEKGRRHHRGA